MEKSIRKKKQFTRDLEEHTKLYQGMNDQSYCNPDTRRFQKTIVWFSENTCTTFQVANNRARMIQFHQKYSLESLNFEKINPDKMRSKEQRLLNIDGIENKLTCFQIYPGTAVACKYTPRLYKKQYSEIHVEYEKVFDMKTGKLIVKTAYPYQSCNDYNSYIPVTFLKNTGNAVGKLRPQDKSSTRLQELSLMNKTYFCAIHYVIHWIAQ